MPHSYASLTQLKDPGYLRLSDVTTYDTNLLRMLENASEAIDHICRLRHFHCLEGVYYFDGSGRTLLPSDDILSITKLELDTDGDGTYETSLDDTEYFMYPLNDYPKLFLKLNYQSGQGGFASGIIGGVKITGVFGYGDGLSATPYYATSITGTVATKTGTTLTLSDEGTIQAGNTIRVKTEQMYVSAVTSDGSKAATVTRGTNGTTADTYSKEVISIYQYPGEIVEATLILVTGWWKQRENPGKFIEGDNVMGTYAITKDIESLIRSRINHYIRRKLI